MPLLPILGAVSAGLGLVSSLGLFSRPRYRPPSTPYYGTGLGYFEQITSPTYGIQPFLRMAAAGPTLADYGALYAMRGGSGLMAQAAFTAAQRQQMDAALSAFQQYRLGLTQTAASLLGQGMGIDAERLGLARQDYWLAQQRRASFFNNLLMGGVALLGTGWAMGNMMRQPPWGAFVDPFAPVRPLYPGFGGYIQQIG